MPDNSQDEAARSIIDRLIDDNPGSLHEQPRTGKQLMREIRDSVRRDLEALINTRWRCEAWPPDFAELDRSLVNYGIPDFTSVGANVAENPDELLDQIYYAIKTFEPRLKNVRLEQLRDRSSVDRVFRFRIIGTLAVQQGDEVMEDSVSFESALEPTTGSFDVTRPGQ